ncbi:MAG: NAD(P)/FAD-dependent oxidoreductase [Stellaceae bacterium]
MRTDREKLVVIGNGMAGLRMIEVLLRHVPRRYDVTVFGAEPHAAYNRVLLSAVLAGEKAAAEIFSQPPEWYAARGIALYTGDPVTAVDAAARTVTSRAGRRMSYDKLVLATGSRPLAPPIPGLDLAGVFAFRDIGDVEAMIGAAGQSSHAVVIGGGLLGLEAAWGLHRRGTSVTVVHLMPTLMERQLDATAGQLLQHDLGRRGIAFVTKGEAEEIYGRGHVEGVRLADGRDLPADLVVMAIGTCPEIGLARQAGLDVNRGVTVDDALRTSDPDIYAVGECAEHRGRCFGLVAPVWEMAETCAERLAGDDSALFGTPVLSTQLKITGIDVFSAGALMAEAESDDEITYLDGAGGIYKKLVLRDDKIVGAVLYGDIADCAWYLRLMRQAADVSRIRTDLIFGASIAVPANDLGNRDRISAPTPRRGGSPEPSLEVARG